jgi:putative transposase
LVQLASQQFKPRPFRITTEAGAKAAASMPDLVKRDFTADRPDVRFVADMTYIHNWQGFIYLASVIDCHSKSVVGRSSPIICAPSSSPTLSRTLLRRP